MNNITKKAYVKPDIALVDFSLSSSIAASCRFTEYTNNDTSCSYTDDGGWIHFAEASICEDFQHDEDFCYHVPTDDVSVFAS